MGIIITIAVIALLVLWVISVQRKLVNADELCQNSMSTIGVQQESRWDALTGEVELIKTYNEHEYNTLRDVIAQRRPISGSSNSILFRIKHSNCNPRIPSQSGNWSREAKR